MSLLILIGWFWEDTTLWLLQWFCSIPIGSMYGVYLPTFLIKSTIHVGKYTIPVPWILWDWVWKQTTVEQLNQMTTSEIWGAKPWQRGGELRSLALSSLWSCPTILDMLVLLQDRLRNYTWPGPCSQGICLNLAVCVCVCPHCKSCLWRKVRRAASSDGITLPMPWICTPWSPWCVFDV